MKEIILIITYVLLFANVIYADYFDSPEWSDYYYNQGIEPDYADGDLEDKLGDSGYYYDLFPEERDGEPDDYVSNANSTKTDNNNPAIIYQNNVSGYYNNPKSIRNYGNTYQIKIVDANGNVIGYTNEGNASETSNNNNNIKHNTGFTVLNNNIYYIKDDGTFKTQWLQINEDWYYFDKDTFAMLHDEARNINNRLYYFNSDGRMAKNTNMIINGVYYNIDNNGVCKY